MDFGADNQIRTDDLVITNDVLYRLSHISVLSLDDSYIIPNKNRFVNPFLKKNQKKLRFDFLHCFWAIKSIKIGNIDAKKKIKQRSSAFE